MPSSPTETALSGADLLAFLVIIIAIVPNRLSPSGAKLRSQQQQGRSQAKKPFCRGKGKGFHGATFQHYVKRKSPRMHLPNIPTLYIFGCQNNIAYF